MRLLGWSTAPALLGELCPELEEHEGATIALNTQEVVFHRGQACMLYSVAKAAVAQRSDRCQLTHTSRGIKPKTKVSAEVVEEKSCCWLLPTFRPSLSCTKSTAISLFIFMASPTPVCIALYPSSPCLYGCQDARHIGLRVHPPPVWSHLTELYLQ